MDMLNGVMSNDPGHVMIPATNHHQLHSNVITNCDVMMTASTQPRNVMMAASAQPRNGMMTSSAQPRNGMMPSSTQPRNGMMPSSTQPRNGMMSSSTQPRNGMMPSSTQPRNGMMSSSTQPRNIMMTSSTQPHNGMMTSSTQPRDGMMTPSTQPRADLMTASTQPRNTLMTSSTQMMTPSTQPRDVTMMTSTQPLDVMMTSSTQPRDIMMTSSSQPRDVTMMTSSSQPQYGHRQVGVGEDERVVQAILVSHNGPQSFPEFKSNNGMQTLGSPYVKITERDGKFDSWVVLPLREFQDIYHNNIEFVRKHLFGSATSKPETGVFPCEDCGYVYNKEYNLRRHRREKHAVIVKRVKCPYCGKFYLREDNLVRHVRNVHNQDERCVCIHCGADFYRYASLKRHILTKHKDSKAHKCTLCEKRYAFKWELKIHTQNQHVMEPGYNCNLCNKSFKRPQTLGEHKKFYHEGYRVICKIDNCNELFNTMANYKKHKREMHVHGDGTMKRGPAQSDERHKSYQVVPVESLGEVRCCTCGVACHGRVELQKHYKKEHAPDDKRKHRTPKMAPSVLFRCNLCVTSFKTKENYESHCVKFHSSGASPQVSMQYPFGGSKEAVSCCDGDCDNLDLSVTSQLLALQQGDGSGGNVA